MQAQGVGRERVRYVPHPETCEKASSPAVLACTVGSSYPGTEATGENFLPVGRSLYRRALVSTWPTPAGAQALECYSCVQKADDGCSPHKMKTVKCGPGVDVCTEAVGAVETSKCHPVVSDLPLGLLQCGSASVQTFLILVTPFHSSSTEMPFFLRA